MPRGRRDEAAHGDGSARDREPAPRARRKTRAPRPGRRRLLQTWPGLAGAAVAACLALYACFALFVSASNGTYLEVTLAVRQGPDGALQLSCEASAPDPCEGGRVSVGTRDRVRLSLVAPATNGTVRVWLDEGPYALWPAGFGLSCPGASLPGPCDAESFTAWASGTYAIRCAVDDAPPHTCGTLVVG